MGTCALMRHQNNIKYNREYKIHKTQQGNGVVICI